MSRTFLCLVFLFIADVAVGQDFASDIFEFDFPAVHIGVAEYEDGPTGTTVFYFPDPVKGAIDVRGGAPGTVNASVLENSEETAQVDAVVFSGGSWYGLSAATGVANGIKELKDREGNGDYIAGVIGAIIYDVGARRFTRVTPDDALGVQALNNAKPGRFPMGAAGAGRFAMQGWYYGRYYNNAGDDSAPAAMHSGQGAAFRQLGPTKIVVFSVVNPMGAIVDRSGAVVRCRRNESDADCPDIVDQIERSITDKARRIERPSGPTPNTTITLVMTNQKLEYASLSRLAKQVHTSMGRAIQPFATEYDGDVLIAVTTDEVDNPDLPAIDLGVVASELAWDAVLNSIPDLPAGPDATVDSFDLEAVSGIVGMYQFPGDSRLSIEVDDSGLFARFEGGVNVYFSSGETYRLLPLAKGEFIVDGPAKDVIRFDEEQDGRIKLLLNPGPWVQTAVRTPGH